MYKVEHTNFGTSYEFESLWEAKHFVVKNGYEAVVYGVDGEQHSSYSPISGWKIVGWRRVW